MCASESKPERLAGAVWTSAPTNRNQSQSNSSVSPEHSWPRASERASMGVARAHPPDDNNGGREHKRIGEPLKPEVAGVP